MVAQIKAVDGVADAQAEVSGYTQIIKRNGKALGNPNQGPPTFGGNWDPNPSLNPFHLVSGRAPRDAGEAVMDAESATTTGYKIGEQFPMLTTTGKVTKTLVGIAAFGKAKSAGGSSMVAFTLREAQRLVGQVGQVTEVRIAADPGVSQDQVTANVRAANIKHVDVITGTKAAADAKKEATAFLSFFTVFLLVFAVIALLVGAFIIANTFSILVAQRTKELALLRAIGASRRQVLASVVIEAAVVGVVASAAGLGLGYLIATLLQRAMMGSSSLASGTTLSVRTVVASFAIGIGVTVLSALLPARRAAKVAPVTAMRESTVEDTSKGTIRAVVGAVLLLITALALIGAATANDAKLVGVGAVAGLAGAVVFGPTLAGWMARLLGMVARRRGMAGKLGMENVLRNPRRTASTASALMIGATLVCAIAVFAASAVASINKLVDTGFNGDVVVTSTGNGLPVSDVAKLEQDPQVGTVAALQYAPVTLDGSTNLVAASDPKALGELIDLQLQSGSLASLGANGLAISQVKADNNGWKVGTTLPIKLLDGTSKTMTVKAIYLNRLLVQDVVADTTAVQGSLVSPLAQFAFVDAKPGMSATQLRNHVSAELKDNPTAKVQTNDEFKSSAAAQMNTFLTIVYAMLALAVIIAIIGIVNTLALSIMERTRELGLLRAVGMTKRQLRTTVRTEALLIALTGTIIGMVLGTAIGASLMKSFGPSQALTGFAIPTTRLIVVLVAGVIVGLFAAIFPARRATRLDPLDALATE